MENNDTLEVIQRIPLDKLRPYPDHPFGVRDDDMMQQTVESIKQFGVLVPGIARPLPDGTYELIAGHRRKQASAIAGLTDMPIIVRDIDRNAATIIMVDSNLQRENILPSEKAKAYKMKLEAIKRQAGRPGKNSAQVGQNLEGKSSRAQIAENSPDSSCFFLPPITACFCGSWTALTGEKSTSISPISRASIRSITRSTKSQRAYTPELQRSALTSLQIPSL